MLGAAGFKSGSDGEAGGNGFDFTRHDRGDFGHDVADPAGAQRAAEFPFGGGMDVGKGQAEESLVALDRCQGPALPRQFAVMYLDWRGEWRLRPMNGIASAPLLYDDGAISCNEGYDPNSGMWSENVPDLQGLIPERLTKEDAIAAGSIRACVIIVGPPSRAGA